MRQTQPIRILLVEDHQVVREGIRSLLDAQTDIQVQAEATDGDSALKLAMHYKPDVVIMDIGLPELSGIDATRQISKAVPTTTVVILSMHADGTTVNRAVRAGARGYVLKGSGIATLCAAVRAASTGEIYIDQQISEYVAHRHMSAPVPKSGPLSPREREVLRLIASGRTGRQVATQLGIKPKTVENHRANVMDKLGIRSTAGLVRYALESGIIE